MMNLLLFDIPPVSGGGGTALVAIIIFVLAFVTILVLAFVLFLVWSKRRKANAAIAASTQATSPNQ